MDIEREFTEKGLKLLDTEYKGVDKSVDCIALCGHQKKLSLSNLRINHGLYCRKCSYSIGSSKRSHSHESVAKHFKENGCELLSTYKNMEQKLEYIATCGHKNIINYNKFKDAKQGLLCSECRFLKGKDHPRYNAELTDEERIINRDYTEIIKWRKAVYERDWFTCQKCLQPKTYQRRIVAHHISSYGSDKENRTVVENGITLCTACHIEFHKKYGYGKNTKGQYKEWSDGDPETKHNVKVVARRNA